MTILFLPIIVSLCGGVTSVHAHADTTVDAEARLETLTEGLLYDSPNYLTRETAHEHALAALSVETDQVSAELLLGIAWRESHYSELAKPQCGVVQVTRSEIRRQYGRRISCQEVLDEGLAAQYRVGVTALEEHMRTCKRMKRGTVKCMLNSYAEGPKAGRRGWGVKGCKAKTHCDRSRVPLAHARRIAAGGWSHDGSV
jgi:predicted RNA-binding Zn-ribbon protein involved in translation (DUF1610 family)